MAWKENAQHELSNEITAKLADEAPFVKGWVLCVNYIGDDGEEHTIVQRQEAQGKVMSLGLLHYGMIVETASA